MKKEKIQKIVNLALHGGTDGERSAARTILIANGIDPDTWQPEPDPEIAVTFTYKNAFERILIFQTYFKLTNTDEISFSKISARKMLVYIQKSKEKRLESDVETILSSWRRELRKFEDSFICSNRLFSDTPVEAKNENVMTEEEIEEIFAMARQIKPVTLGNQLKGKK